MPKATRSPDLLATRFIMLIGKLFAAEARSKRSNNWELERRQRLRRRYSMRILDAIYALALAQSSGVVPKSLLGKALTYLREQWPKLIRYVENGNWPISNNPCENAIRPFVVGRRSWLFSDTVAGANASANLYSLIETCKAGRIDPYRYLHWCCSSAFLWRRTLTTTTGCFLGRCPQISADPLRYPTSSALPSPSERRRSWTAYSRSDGPFGVRTLRRVLNDGHAAMIFPEGLTSPDGRACEEQRGVEWLAYRRGAEIVTLHIRRRSAKSPLCKAGHRLVARDPYSWINTMRASRATFSIAQTCTVRAFVTIAMETRVVVKPENLMHKRLPQWRKKEMKQRMLVIAMLFSIVAEAHAVSAQAEQTLEVNNGDQFDCAPFPTNPMKSPINRGTIVCRWNVRWNNRPPSGQVEQNPQFRCNRMVFRP